MKLLYHTWFRTGSAYTSKGIIDFLEEVNASLPTTIKKVFFRADSGFFSGALFDLLESFDWDYLVRVKLKNLDNLIKQQTWVTVDEKNDIAICQFPYKANRWSKTRIFKTMRSVEKYVQLEYLVKQQVVPVYQYVCYASNLELDANELHELYKKRSISETRIEQVKGHVMAGSTLTSDFWANDILWQLNVLAYNLSVMMRQKKIKFKKQELRTFIDWFIAVPAKITSSGHQIELKIYEHIFIKTTERSLIGSSMWHKHRESRKNMDTNTQVYGRGTFT